MVGSKEKGHGRSGPGDKDAEKEVTTEESTPEWCNSERKVVESKARKRCVRFSPLRGYDCCWWWWCWMGPPPWTRHATYIEREREERSGEWRRKKIKSPSQPVRRGEGEYQPEKRGCRDHHHHHHHVHRRRRHAYQLELRPAAAATATKVKCYGIRPSAKRMGVCYYAMLHKCTRLYRLIIGWPRSFR